MLIRLISQSIYALAIDQAFIFIMVANPKPNNGVPVLNTKSAVSNSDSN
jgi:hypothetical protein